MPRRSVAPAADGLGDPVNTLAGADWSWRERKPGWVGPSRTHSQPEVLASHDSARLTVHGRRPIVNPTPKAGSGPHRRSDEVFRRKGVKTWIDRHAADGEAGWWTVLAAAHVTTPARATGASRSKRTDRPPPVGPVTSSVASTPARTCPLAGGASRATVDHSRSADTCGKFPDDASMWLSHDSIYQAVYESGSVLVPSATVSPASLAAPIRARSPNCRATRATASAADPEDPSVALRAEDRFCRPLGGGLDRGQGPGWAIGTLVERQARMVRLLHLPSRDSNALHWALRARMSDVPRELTRSITLGQRNEIARDTQIAPSLRANDLLRPLPLAILAWPPLERETPVDSCASTSQRGTNLDVRLPGHLAVEHEIHNRPDGSWWTPHRATFTELRPSKVSRCCDGGWEPALPLTDVDAAREGVSP
jgi:hypothetical protein